MDDASLTLTITDLPDHVAKALEREARLRRRSLNETAIDLLVRSLEGTKSNGLRHLAGRWDEQELAEFEQAIAPFEQVDERGRDD